MFGGTSFVSGRGRLRHRTSGSQFGTGGLQNGPYPVGGPSPLVQLVDGQPGADEGRATSEVLLRVQGPAARTC